MDCTNEPLIDRIKAKKILDTHCRQFSTFLFDTPISLTYKIFEGLQVKKQYLQLNLLMDICRLIKLRNDLFFSQIFGIFRNLNIHGQHQMTKKYLRLEQLKLILKSKQILISIFSIFSKISIVNLSLKTLHDTGYSNLSNSKR